MSDLALMACWEHPCLVLGVDSRLVYKYPASHCVHVKLMLLEVRCHGREGRLYCL